MKKIFIYINNSFINFLSSILSINCPMVSMQYLSLEFSSMIKDLPGSRLMSIRWHWTLDFRYSKNFSKCIILVDMHPLNKSARITEEEETKSITQKGNTRRHIHGYHNQPILYRHLNQTITNYILILEHTHTKQAHNINRAHIVPYS